MTINWKNPADGDFDHVVVSREPGRPASRASVVYEGSGANLVDKGLEVGTQYRYLLVTYDQARATIPPALRSSPSGGSSSCAGRPMERSQTASDAQVGEDRRRALLQRAALVRAQPSVGRRGSLAEGLHGLATEEQAEAQRKWTYAGSATR